VSRNQKTEEDGKAEMKKNRVNLFQDLPGHLDQELVETLQAHDSFRIERIVSRGHISPREFWYDQEEHEWVTVLTGKAQLQIEGEEALVTLCPGDTYDLPAHTKHRVAWTEPNHDTIWLAVFWKSA
jgi:cupin 2 domain-containing protein